MNNPTNKELLDFLVERFKIEREKFDRSGVCMRTHSVYLLTTRIRLKEVHLLRNRLLHYLIIGLFLNQMIIIEPKMLKR